MTSNQQGGGRPRRAQDPEGQDGSARGSTRRPASAAAGGDRAAPRLGGRPKRKAAGRAPAAQASTDRADRALGAKIVTVGSISSDVIAVAEPGLVERAQFERAGVTYMMVEEGRKYTAQSISSHIGGGGANTAISAARQGWRSTALGVVGQDATGDLALARLAENGVETGAIRRSADAETGVSLMVTSDRPNAAILVYRGANETLRLDDIRDPVFDGARLVYIGPLSSGSADCFPALVEQGAWAGAMVAVNPGVRQLRTRMDAFLGALANVDLISLNALELSVLAPPLIARGLLEAASAEPSCAGGEKRLLARNIGEGPLRAPLRSVLEALHRLGPRFLCITDGSHGAYLSVAEPDGGAAATLLFTPAAPAEIVRGTAGAGDAYGSTLACALAEGAAPGAAMRRAAVNAASVVSFVNTTDGLLTRRALEERLAELALEAAETL